MEAPERRKRRQPIWIEKAFSAGRAPWPLRDIGRSPARRTPGILEGALMLSKDPFCAEGERDGGFGSTCGSAEVKASNSDLDCAEVLETKDPPCASSVGQRSCWRSSENIFPLRTGPQVPPCWVIERLTPLLRFDGRSTVKPVLLLS